MSHKSDVRIHQTTIPYGWQLRGKCAGNDTEDFIFDPYHGRHPTKYHLQLKANFCDQCKVAGKCKQFAIETKSTGLFGGVFLDEGKIVR